MVHYAVVSGRRLGRFEALLTIKLLGNLGTWLLRRASTMLTVGVIAGIHAIGFSVAIAALLFAGPLEPGFALGAGAALLCTATVAIVVGLRSQIASNIAHIQDLAAIILAVYLASSVAVLDASVETKLATAFAVIALSSVATGLLLWGAGYFGFGRLVRLFPQTVFAGFLAGTGWLLVAGGVGLVMTVRPEVTATFGATAIVNLPFVLPALGLAIALLLGMQITKTPTSLIALLLSAIVGFYLLLWINGASVESARAQGWMPSLPDTGVIALPVAHYSALVSWPDVVVATPTILTIAVLCLLATLLNTSALESMVGADIDYNAELRITGGANLLVGLAAAPPGYSGLGISALAARSGVRQRGAGIIAGIIVLVGFFYAREIAAHIPNFVNAGLIIFIGIDLLKTWVFDTRSRYSRAEWLVVATILLVVAVFGFAAAITAGLSIATIMFVYSYASIPVIRSIATLERIQSTVERPRDEIEALNANGACVDVVQLQGYLFFGTADQVNSAVSQRLADNNLPTLRYLLLDFQHVSNIDSASATSLARTCALSDRSGVSLLVSGWNENVRMVLDRVTGAIEPPVSWQAFSSLDQALEYVEEQVLSEVVGDRIPRTLIEHLAIDTSEHLALAHLLDSLIAQTFRAGDVLISAGGSSDEIYLLEQGRVSVRKPNSDDRNARLRAMSAGAILGDIGLVSGVKRTVDVVAETDGTMLCVPRATIARLERDEPHLAILLHQVISRALAEKILTANKMTDHVKAW